MLRTFEPKKPTLRHVMLTNKFIMEYTQTSCYIRFFSVFLQILFYFTQVECSDEQRKEMRGT